MGAESLHLSFFPPSVPLLVQEKFSKLRFDSGVGGTHFHAPVHTLLLLPPSSHRKDRQKDMEHPPKKREEEEPTAITIQRQLKTPVLMSLAI